MKLLKILFLTSVIFMMISCGDNSYQNPSSDMDEQQNQVTEAIPSPTIPELKNNKIYEELMSLEEKQRNEKVISEYINPLLKSGIIANYYKNADIIGKMLNYYACNEIIPKLEKYKNQYSYNSDKNTIEIPADDVMEYMQSVFLQAETFYWKLHNSYNEKTDCFVIELDSDKYKVSEQLCDIDISISETMMTVNYHIKDSGGNIIGREEILYKFVDDKCLYYYTTDEIIDEKYNTSLPQGRFTIVSEEPVGGGDFFAEKRYIEDTATGQKKYIGEVPLNQNAGTGFMSNGDVYMLNGYEFAIYDTDMINNQPVFTTRYNFPAGDYLETDRYNRIILAVRRNTSDEYMVVYTEYSAENYNNRNYKVGVLDRKGNLVRSCETELSVLLGEAGYHQVEIKKISDYYYDVYILGKYGDLMSAFSYDTVTNEYLPIKRLYTIG